MVRFVGAWLLVAGPLDQAVRELEEEDFERESLTRAAAHVGPLSPVSSWWLLVPPVYYVLHRRRNNAYRRQVAEAMTGEELAEFAHLRDVFGAWAWELREAYEWPRWSFWALVAAMLLLCAARTATRTRRRQRALGGG